MMSSAMPSAKYSCSGSPLMFWNGSTAIDGLSGKASEGFVDSPIAGLEGLGCVLSRTRWTRIGRGDILDLLLAHIFKREGELVAHLVAHHPADADPARLGEGF